MSNTLEKIYPREFATRKEAWSSLLKDRQIKLADISVLLRAEASLFSAVNNGRTDRSLQFDLNFNTKADKEAGIRYFLLSKRMLEIADQNMKKVAHLNNKTTSTSSLKEYYSDKLRLIDQMIEVLGSTV